MQRPPTTEQLLAVLMRNASVPFAEMRAATRGRMFDVPVQYVEPAATDCNARFEVAPPDVLAELADVLAEPVTQGELNPRGFRLAVRRLRDVQNTMYHQLNSISRRLPQNFAYMHPDDMGALELEEGDQVELATPHGAIELPARADDSVRRGVVSVPHGWGDLLHECAPNIAKHAPGTNTNELTSADSGCDPINAMPCLTGLPLSVRALAH
jgi:anaerobic selenocysteine-containing dehydrogenase